MTDEREALRERIARAIALPYTTPGERHYQQADAVLAELAPELTKPSPLVVPDLPPQRKYELKVLRSVYETQDVPPQERIAEIMDFLDRAGRRKAERMIAGLEQHEARRVLDEAICEEKL